MNRRELSFATFEEVISDVDRLLANGYTKTGNWELAQICDHCYRAMAGAVAGFPFKMPWPIQVFKKFTQLRPILRTGKMPTGMKLPPAALPKEGGDPAKSARRFKEMLGRVSEHDEPFHPHPLYGKLTRDQWLNLFRIHAAHHLSFLIPNDKPASAT